MMSTTNLGSNDYQVQLMEKEEARLKGKREAYEARTKRFLDSKKRIIGIDVEALNAQVLDKQRRQQMEDEEKRLDRLNVIRMERALEEAALADRRARMNHNSILKESWGAATIAKNAIPPQPETDYARCGPASAQIFQGEDVGRLVRLQQQRGQMMSWIGEGKDERSECKRAEDEEEKRWADFVREATLLREKAEARELELMKAHIAEVARSNRDLAIIQQTSRAKDTSFAMTSIPAFNSEDVTAAMDEYGRIVRRDMFRGYTAEQRHRIMLDNEEVMRMRREALYSEQQEDASWVLQQLAQTRAMEQALYEERRLRGELQEDHMDTLRRQAEEAEDRRAEERRERSGGIGDEFFDRFGRDCR